MWVSNADIIKQNHAVITCSNSVHLICFQRCTTTISSLRVSTICHEVERCQDDFSQIRLFGYSMPLLFAFLFKHVGGKYTKM